MIIILSKSIRIVSSEYFYLLEQIYYNINLVYTTKKRVSGTREHGVKKQHLVGAPF